MSTSVSIAAKPGFYEKIVLGLLSGMDQGRLYLVMPDGRQFSVGNGEHPLSATIEIKDPNFFRRCVLYGDIGFGEAYVEGEWETDSIQNVIKWFLLNVDKRPSSAGSDFEKNR